MRGPRALAMLVLPLALAACGPEGPTKADTGTLIGGVAGGVLGSQFGKGNGRIAGAIAGTMIGGVIGHEIGKGLDARDRELAAEAEFLALERGNFGAANRWRNPDTGRHGEVVPSRPYRRGAEDCRDYSHTIYIDGRPQTMRGTACRNPDGTWTAIS